MSHAAATMDSTWLSDEAILGIEPDSSAAPPQQPAPPRGEIPRPEDGLGMTPGGRGDANRASDAHSSSDALQDADRADADRDSLATGHEPRAAERDSRTAAPPDGGKHDTSVTIAALPVATLEQLDAAYYSPEPAARAQFAQTLFASDPTAFRAMFNEAARLLGVPVGQALLPVPLSSTQEQSRAEASSAPTTAKTNHSPAADVSAVGAELASARLAEPQSELSVANGPTPANSNAAVPPVAPGFSPASPAFPAQQYRAFEAATNDALSRDVRGAIGSTLEQVLPEGTSAGAARRIADDIYTDIGKQLASDAQLSSQIGEVLRGWHFGPGEQQQVSTLLTARARQLLPSAARKVIGEWSTHVLDTARTRAARSEASASRVDVGNAASRPAASSEPARAPKPREIDYARTSDDDIFAM